MRRQEMPGRIPIPQFITVASGQQSELHRGKAPLYSPKSQAKKKPDANAGQGRDSVEVYSCVSANSRWPSKLQNCSPTMSMAWC